MKKSYFGDKRFDKDYFTGKILAGYQGGYNKRTLSKGYDCYTRFKKDAKYIKGLGIGSYFEIGCACGYLMEELFKLGIKVRGWDISKFIVEKAAPEIRPFIEIKDISQISTLPDKFFDLVHVSTVLGYVPLGKLDYYLSEIERIAKKYVIIYAGTPDKNDSPEENSIRLINRSDTWWNKQFAKHFEIKDIENCLWEVK